MGMVRTLADLLNELLPRQTGEHQVQQYQVKVFRSAHNNPSLPEKAAWLW